MREYTSLQIDYVRIRIGLGVNWLPNESNQLLPPEFLLCSVKYWIYWQDTKISIEYCSILSWVGTR